MKGGKIALDEMVRELVASYGASLHAVVLYGSAATTEHDPHRSDYNLLMVVDRTVSFETERGSRAVQRWASSGNPPPLVFTEEEWRASADIFPMEHLDVLESHRVLHGIFAQREARVDLTHLRLQLEQETMGALLRMRQGALAAGASAPARAELLQGMFSRILVLMRALIRLHLQHPPPGNHDIIEMAGKLGSFDARCFLRVWESLRRGAGISAEQSGEILHASLAALASLVEHVDRFRPAEPSYAATPHEVSTGEMPE